MGINSLVRIVGLSAALVAAAGAAFAQAPYVPPVENLLFSVKTSDLPDSGTINTWGIFNKVGTPTVATFADPTTGVSTRWAQIGPSNGFSTPNTANVTNAGFTIVTAVRPDLTNHGSGYRHILNLFGTGVQLDTRASGQLAVRWQTVSTTGSITNMEWMSPIALALADDVPTVISLVISNTGTVNLWAGDTFLGSQTNALWPSGTLYKGTNFGGFNLGTPSTSASANNALNGSIGDTYVYTTDQVDRLALVNHVKSSMNMVPPTNAVPEPASILLGVMGLGSVLGVRRFKK